MGNGPPRSAPPGHWTQAHSPSVGGYSRGRSCEHCTDTDRSARARVLRPGRFRGDGCRAQRLRPKSGPGHDGASAPAVMQLRLMVPAVADQAGRSHASRFVAWKHAPSAARAGGDSGCLSQEYHGYPHCQARVAAASERGRASGHRAASASRRAKRELLERKLLRSLAAGPCAERWTRIVDHR
jgi:hypothetical protein